METDQSISEIALRQITSRQITLTDPETVVEIKKLPSMGFVFLKALLIAPFRSNTIKDDAIVNKTRIILKNYLPDKELINNYRTVCGFSDDRPDIIPISYLQTLFIGLLGKFIISSFFPINPLGLIHIFQSFEQKRPVKTNEILDLACTLKSIEKTQKGIETSFTLEVISSGQIVWQGISTFFTRSPVKIKKKTKKKDDTILIKQETFFIPSDTGRKYAVVSGDYNPHHLHTLLAKLFGFKKAIAHGMWSLARVIASLDKEFGIHDRAVIEASFKLPIYMPASIALGYECQEDTKDHQTVVIFELRDEQKELPHLKGRLLYKNQE
ncbi:MAG: hypothetical protein K8S13_14590 [Desulfobacula sp.]|uniref:MaoC/PaaZ C-terminal domain-containing protein n=1 Tax=Desulfobacula sp. TaxID=2593537 RepID=UPI0025BE233C|nr:MaoC/PaaZ C-terminal domain-containing protein [Desulfobacula sp.]MCD4721065.1 hypothetical protein [Desulfobacula sp.]